MSRPCVCLVAENDTVRTQFEVRRATHMRNTLHCLATRELPLLLIFSTQCDEKSFVYGLSGCSPRHHAYEALKESGQNWVMEEAASGYFYVWKCIYGGCDG